MLEGGLGIPSLKFRNYAMVGKWWWRMFCNRKDFWHKTLVSLHGNEMNHDLSDFKVTRYMSPIIKDMLSIGNCPQMENLMVQNNFEWIVGDGNLVSFWHDCWHTYGPLKLKFLGFYDLSRYKEESIAQIVRLTSLNSHRLPSNLAW